jgi:hypothetical protein
VAVETQRKLDEALRQLALTKDRDEKRKRDVCRTFYGHYLHTSPYCLSSHGPARPFLPPSADTHACALSGCRIGGGYSPSSSFWGYTEALSDDEKRYQERREKNLTKLPAWRLHGNQVGDLESIDHWVRVATRYVEGLYHGMVGMEVERDKMDFILGILPFVARQPLKWLSGRQL